MICRALPYYEFAQGVFEIDEFDCASIFVMVGSQRAVVLDTGVGIGDLKWVIENRITDKPYDVIISHNHGDHIGGAGWFKEVWVHPEDLNWNGAETAPMMQFRRGYAETIRLREHRHYSYDAERDIRPWPAAPQKHTLADGQVFDLGNRKVTVHHCPGHTKGEIVLIDDLTRTLFLGDACNCNILLGSDIAPTGPERFRAALSGLSGITALKDQYDIMYNSHHDFRGFGSPLAPNVLPDAVRCLQSLVDHTAEFKQIPDPLFSDRPPKTVAVCGDVMISYLSEDISDS